MSKNNVRLSTIVYNLSDDMKNHLNGMNSMCTVINSVKVLMLFARRHNHAR